MTVTDNDGNSYGKMTLVPSANTSNGAQLQYLLDEELQANFQEKSGMKMLNGKQVIHGYLILNDVVVAVVGDTISCYHDKMKGTSVFRQFLVCTLFVLQIFRIVIVNGEDVIGVFHLTEVGKAVGSLYHQVNLRPASLGCSTGKP